jgi:hypothetical protein
MCNTLNAAAAGYVTYADRTYLFALQVTISTTICNLTKLPRNCCLGGTSPIGHWTFRPARVPYQHPKSKFLFEKKMCFCHCIDSHITNIRHTLLIIIVFFSWPGGLSRSALCNQSAQSTSANVMLVYLTGLVCSETAVKLRCCQFALDPCML